MPVRSHDWANQSSPSGIRVWLGEMDDTIAALAGTLLVRPLEGIGRLPSAMAAPPTLTPGVANAASAIASSVLISPNEPNCFTYFGGVPKRGATFPDYLGFSMTGVYPVTTTPPWAMEFVLDTADATGRFEIYCKGAGGKCRLLVWEAGQWKYATAAASFTLPADGNGYKHLVTMGAAGTYRIRIEMEGLFRLYGIQIAPTDGLSATSKRQPWIAVGDSFAEPTITDSGSSIASQGFTMQLAYLTGWDIWAAGKGGTGYLNPGASVKYRDRLAELTAYSPYGLIWAGGLNDQAFGGMTYNTLYAEVLACLDQAYAAGVPYSRQIVLSPFWRGDYSTVTSGMVVVRDATKDAAAARGCPYVDLIAPEPYVAAPDTIAVGTLQAGVSGGATTISSNVPIPADTQLIGTSYVVLIGNPGSATVEMRKVTAIAGTGPYTLTVAALSNAHSSGEQIRQVAQPIWTGTGRQGTTTGVGNSDRYVGGDSTHPTVAGHAFLARQIYKQLALKIPAVT